MTTDSLFRTEALQARQTALGSLYVSHSRAFAWAVAGVVASALALLLLLLFGTYGSRATGVGQLQPSGGLITLQPLVSGTLDQVAAHEGQRVRRGEVLAVVSVDPQPGTGLALGQDVARAIDDRRRAAEANAEAQRLSLEQEETGLSAQLTATRTERSRLQDQIRTTQQRQALAAETRARLTEIRQRGYLSELQVQQAQAEELQLVAGVQALQREEAALARTLTQLQQQLDGLPSRRQALAAQRQAELARLSQEDAETRARQTRRLEAPRDGVITARLAEPGQGVQAGQGILTLLPTGTELEAHLLVPSRAVGFIAPGDAVRLRYQAFPYQKFGHQTGHVARVSRSAIATPPGATDTQYRVVVTLDRQTVTAYGQEEALLPGMQVEADILLEERRLIEWVLEPLYALHGRMRQ